MKQEAMQRSSYARALLDRGVKPASIATMVSAKYSVARSTAYLDLQAAQAESDKSDDGPASEELGTIDPASIQAQLAHMIDVAAAVGDGKTIAQLIKSLDTVKRWNGYQSESVSPYA